MKPEVLKIMHYYLEAFNFFKLSQINVIILSWLRSDMIWLTKQLRYKLCSEDDLDKKWRLV